MKRLVVIALLSVFLTGCVNQSDYDDLVKKNEKLEDKIDSLNDEIDSLEEKIDDLTNENKELKALKDTTNNSASPNTTKESDFMFSSRYEDNKTGNAITAYVSLTKDNHKKLNILFFPSMDDIKDTTTHEDNCSYFLMTALALCLKYETNYYDIEIIDTEAYCSISYDSNGDIIPSITSYDRDGTFHNSDIDHETADWFKSDDYTQFNPSNMKWLSDTINQIEKDIEGIYP